MIIFTIKTGLFSINHLLFTLISLSIVALLFLLFYKKELNTIKKSLKYFGIFIILFEILKILLNCFVFKIDNNLTNIVPLYYCSLFIYFFIPTFFKNKAVFDIGVILLKYYGFVPGLCFILYPITAVNYHPLFSFQSLHSLIFHSLMLFISLILLYKDAQPLNKKGFLAYTIITLSFCLIAYIFNIFANTNYMFINYPSSDNDILLFIKKISGFFYPFIIVFFQTLGSLLLTLLVQQIFIKKENKNHDTI